MRLALGQEPRPPLYLLGQLGNTDVRVTRKGDAVEVRVGDAVREVIRLGAPYAIGEDGSYGRERMRDEVAGAERGGTLPGGGVGAQGRDVDPRVVPDIRREPPDTVPCDGGGRPGSDGGPGTEAAWSQATYPLGGADRGVGDGEGGSGEGAEALATEVRGGQGDPGSSAPGGAGREPAWRGGGKKPVPLDAEAEANEYDRQYCGWDAEEDGLEP